jgi:hypothetical protein
MCDTHSMCGSKKAFFAFRVPAGRPGLPDLTAPFDYLPAGTHKALNAMGSGRRPGGVKGTRPGKSRQGRKNPLYLPPFFRPCGAGRSLGPRYPSLPRFARNDMLKRWAMIGRPCGTFPQARSPPKRGNHASRPDAGTQSSGNGPIRATVSRPKCPRAQIFFIPVRIRSYGAFGEAATHFYG